MPTKRKQYNLVLNDAIEHVLWHVGADLRLSNSDAIRELLATHPTMLAKAQALDVELTGQVLRGGYRHGERKTSSSSKPDTSSQVGDLPQVETSASLDKANGNRPAIPKRPIPAFVGNRTGHRTSDE